jgi:K+-sensing histidine kinase KdpD
MGYYLSNAQDYDEKYLAFVSNIHHDLMGPMTFIKGYSDLLLTESYGPLQESQREFIQRINRSVQRAYDSLETHHKLATIESGILLVKREPVNLVPIISNIVNQLPELENYQTLHVDIPENLPAVKALFREAKDILSGLLEGAIAQSLPGAKISLFVQSETDSVRITVSTSSPKPTSKNESEALSPFDFMKFEIFKRYVEQFGGEFGEEIEDGKGNTIWFTLPIVDEQTDI